MVLDQTRRTASSHAAARPNDDDLVALATGRRLPVNLGGVGRANGLRSKEDLGSGRQEQGKEAMERREGRRSRDRSRKKSEWSVAGRLAHFERHHARKYPSDIRHQAAP
jgi:hypothetical protein